MDDKNEYEYEYEYMKDSSRIVIAVYEYVQRCCQRVGITS